MLNNFEVWAAQHGAEELDETAGRQGEVISYNISRPMPLRDYLGLPEHAKKEYLQTLRKMGGGVHQIAAMFGCTTETVLELMKRAGVRAGGRRIDGADVIWAEFTAGYEMPTVSAEAPEIPGAAEAEENRGPGPRGSAAPTGAEEDGAGVLSGTGDLSHTGAEENRGPGPRGSAAPTETEEGFDRQDVVTELQAFRVVLTGPADGVLARLGIFADLIGSTPVRVTVCVEEEP